MLFQEQLIVRGNTRDGLDLETFQRCMFCFVLLVIDEKVVGEGPVLTHAHAPFW